MIGSLGADPITTGDYYGIKLEHVNTNESFWLNSKVTMGEVRGKHEALYPADEWKYVEIKVLKFISCQDAFDLSDHSCSIQQKLQNVEQKMLLNAFIHSRSLCEVNY